MRRAVDFKLDERSALGRLRGEVTGRGEPLGAGRLAILEQPGVELAHVTDAKFVAGAFQFDAPPAGRVERDVANRRTETGRRQREIVERATHEDAGRVDRLVERLLAIDEHHSQPVAGQQARALQSRQSGPDHGDVVGLHGVHFVLQSC